jgi:hypothetical protein
MKSPAITAGLFFSYWLPFSEVRTTLTGEVVVAIIEGNGSILHRGLTWLWVSPLVVHVSVNVRFLHEDSRRNTLHLLVGFRGENRILQNQITATVDQPYRIPRTDGRIPVGAVSTNGNTYRLCAGRCRPGMRNWLAARATSKWCAARLAPPWKSLWPIGYSRAAVGPKARNDS